MKRVGGLKRQAAAEGMLLSPDGYTAKQQLVMIRRALLPLLAEQERIFLDEIKPQLRAEGIEFLAWNELTQAEKTFAHEYFETRIFPLLIPLAVDAGHPFPFLSNLSLSLGFLLSQPDRKDPLFARVKLSGDVPQWIRLELSDEASSFRFLNMQELVSKHAQQLFPGMNINSCMPFRVTRNINLEIDDEDAEDLMDAIEAELRQRRVGQLVRFEHGPDADPWMKDFLIEELELAPDDIFEVQGLLDYTSLSTIADLEIPRLHYPRWVPKAPADLGEESSMFTFIRGRDLLVHHPYESFASTVERFIREAAHDPKVLSIKMTLYRVGQATPLIPLLIRAAEEGKQVVCLIELKARFDEKQNIHWAHELEKAGVHVVYGIPGLKIHAKATVIIRQDPDGIRSYAHCATGNYHARTANLYTDVGLFTAKPDFTRELLHFFNYLTGRSHKEDYKKILVAPLTMEKTFLQFIQQEIANCRDGAPSGIIAKMNALEDKHVIEALYEASSGGVDIDLLVRGACSLRPQVAGMSERIRVTSILGRLLEHSRIFYFRNGAKNPVDGLFFIGSADWMNRNLHQRVELCVPVEERSQRIRLWQILEIMLESRPQTWEMCADGSYKPKVLSPGGSERGTHETLMDLESFVPAASEGSHCA
jgi:polyphosphate kinase